MKKRFLLTSILMLLLTVLALSTSTYAWFTMSSEVYVNEFNITAVQTTGGMDISTDGSSWASDKKVTVTTNNPAYDLTSDANGVIYKHKSDDNLSVADASSYNSFNIYLKTTSYGKIQLDLSESYIVPTAYASYVKDDGEFVDSATFVENALEAEGDAETITNKSTSGDFSRDWIAAAFRMSIKVVSFQSNTKANYSLSTDTLPSGYTASVNFIKSLDEVSLTQHSITGKYTVTDEGAGSDVYGIGAAKDNQGQTIANQYAISTTATTYTAKDFLTTDVIDLCKISGETGDLPFNTGDTYIIKLEVKIWIEGQDNEAVLPLTGGQVTSALKFKIDTTGISDPTDYRTEVAFTNASGSTEGLVFTSPSAALTGGILIYKDVEVDNDTEALPADTAKVTTTALAKTSSSYTEGEFEVGETYTLIAPVTLSTGTSGYKATNYFTVGTQAYVYYTITIE